MNLSIKSSLQMSAIKSPLGNIEDNLIRIPKALRDKYGYHSGTFLQFKSKEGKPILLQVTHAYKNDTETDSESAYVSDSTYLLLDISPITIINPAVDILIGCDPEFFLVDGRSGHNISASHFFPHYGQIGSDGGLAELRPRPSIDVQELTNNLKTLICEASNHLKARALYRQNKIDMIASSNNEQVSAGFHIHFGLPKELLNGSNEAMAILLKMVYLLDYYIGIPSIIPEGNEDVYRRSAGYNAYGKPTDFRSDTNTLEYRVPGGHLLRHPVLTIGLFAMCKIVMKDMMSRIGDFTKNFSDASCIKRYDVLKEMYPSLPLRGDVHDSITSNSVLRAFTHSQKIYDDFTKMIGFKQCEPYIKAYFEYIIEYISKNKKFNSNMEQNWRS